MIIRLKVFEQTLSVVDTKSVPRKGSKDYLVLHFLFSSDWKDLEKICYLQHGEVSQPIDVVDGLVEVPEWFTQQDSFDVTLFGTNNGQEVPTNVVALRMENSNTLWEQDAPEPQPSWLAKVIDLNNHPPIPGDNGYWLLWDTDRGAYVESELPLPDMSGIPEGGTSGQLLSKTESGTEWIDPPQSSVQPDWNQNDDTAADYVKNRPFYTGDPVETVFVEESTATFTENNGLYMAEFPSTFSATVGETYKVSWDGASYECTCVNVNQSTIIGNLSIAGTGSDTGEPFLMDVYNGAGILIATTDTSASHTISISQEGEPEVVKIDEKYLPDNPLNITGATVGQIAKITAVDDSGKPTAWEAVDMPSGGAETWELIRSVTIPDGAEEADVLSISTDSDGSQFSLKKAKIFGDFPAYTGESSIPQYSFFEMNGIYVGALAPYCYTSGWVMPHAILAKTCSIEVDLSLPGFQCEKVFRDTDGTKEYFGDKRIDSITSIGGTHMLIYPGCRFALYGVRE